MVQYSNDIKFSLDFISLCQILSPAVERGNKDLGSRGEVLF